MPFKIISYNIWDGLSHGAECRGKFVRWVVAQKPDVMALQELVGFNEEKLAALAAEYGHPYVAIVKEEGYPVGVTSRQPIQVVHKAVKDYWHGMLHVRTFGLDLIVTHLSPFSWAYRLGEAKKLTEYVEAKGLKRYLLMGDLNAFSPFDADELETHVALREEMVDWDRKNPKWGNMRGSHYDYSVLSAFMAIGLRDVVQMQVQVKKRMTYPAAFLYKLNWGDPGVADHHQRLDFILASDDLVPHCQKAAVHNGPENEGISDHYPVSLVMSLPDK